MARISNCCGSLGTKPYPGEPDCNYQDLEICDVCNEHCDYVKDEPDDDDIYSDGGMTANEHREVERLRISNQIGAAVYNSFSHYSNPAELDNLIYQDKMLRK